MTSMLRPIMAMFVILTGGCTAAFVSQRQGNQGASPPCLFFPLMERLSQIPEKEGIDWNTHIPKAPFPDLIPNEITTNFTCFYVDGYKKGYALGFYGYHCVTGMQREPHPLHEAFLLGLRDGNLQGEEVRDQMIFEGRLPPGAIRIQELPKNSHGVIRRQRHAPHLPSPK